MNQTEKFSAVESLALIESMINKAQNKYSENGTLYLLWGWIVFICSLLHYGLLTFTQMGKSASSVWILTVFAMIYQIYYIAKKQRNAQVKNYTDEIIGYVWMVFGICMGLVTFILSQLGTWQLLYAFILLFYGMPTFLTGAIMRFNPLKIGGVICWVLAACSVFVQSREIILLLIPAVLSAWIIPGYLLRAKFKNSIHV